jgi:hypothetical protein
VDFLVQYPRRRRKGRSNSVQVPQAAPSLNTHEHRTNRGFVPQAPAPKTPTFKMGTLRTQNAKRSASAPSANARTESTGSRITSTQSSRHEARAAFGRVAAPTKLQNGHGFPQSRGADDFLDYGREPNLADGKRWSCPRFFIVQLEMTSFVPTRRGPDIVEKAIWRGLSRLGLGVGDAGFSN